MKVELRAHGTQVGSEYAQAWSRAIQPLPLPRESVEDDDGVPVHTRRYGKCERAADTPRSMGRLRHVYADAIAYTGMRTTADGSALVLATILGLPLALGGAWGIAGAFDVRVSGAEAILILGLSGLMAWMGVCMFGGFLDDLFFALEELPIVFDRKHRKVYRLLPDEGTGFWSVVRRRPLVACEYDWDLVEVESRTRASMTLSEADDCSLIFRVRKSRECALLIDSFSIDVRALERGSLEPLWEHIRRYMEEAGPPLPDPAEPLAQPSATRSWWACLRLQGEHAPLFLTHWRVSPVASLLSLLLAPLSLPVRVLWGTGDYLKEKTRIPVRWPALVLERIGWPIPILPEVSGGQEAVTARRDVG